MRKSPSPHNPSGNWNFKNIPTSCSLLEQGPVIILPSVPSTDIKTRVDGPPIPLQWFMNNGPAGNLKMHFFCSRKTLGEEFFPEGAACVEVQQNTVSRLFLFRRHGFKRVYIPYPFLSNEFITELEEMGVIRGCSLSRYVRNEIVIK
ncbi:hypothetical protein CEXT_505251 [Caerostris extrusa]|uniref:Uncharacterized protein n=1 Tax=Caerostris extrusa TaxID=172846 RepID=A0AAV4UCT7_CAEEX|nr:hypothetical protein CEXT_505251 [Caerostris extrusa]